MATLANITSVGARLRKVWVTAGCGNAWHGPCSTGSLQALRPYSASAASSSSGAAEGDFTADQDPGDALVPGGVRVYRRQRAEHERSFRWGIGSKFREQSANRFTPVHKPHPMNTVVRDDYYESSNPNIAWDELREGWEVYWYENSKLTARPFPVKKFGIEKAKTEAFKFFDELEAAGRLGQRPRMEQPQDGVFYDQRMQSWVCFFWRGGRPHSRCFAATKYGYDGAKTLAIAKQNDPISGVLPARGSGGIAEVLRVKGKPPQELKYKGGPTGNKY
eukprot:gb/GFBE01019810.1/.p1 GENE.gb/GFBE01019810.1/~~gb/GFBE01019810.1/.p1  ORF type:complete len:276 (+),score=48.69 gb/GFBE01019810.1/:1-828(+)